MLRRGNTVRRRVGKIDKSAFCLPLHSVRSTKCTARGEVGVMNRVVTLPGLILASFLFVAFFGFGIAQAREQRIGLVNMQVLVEKSDMGKLAQQNMQEEFSAERDEISRLRREVQDMIDEIKVLSPTLTPEAKEAKWLEYIGMKRILDDKTREFTRKVEAAEGRVRKDMVGLFIIAAKSFSEKNGYSLIMDGNQSGVVFADKTLDVTEELLKEVNLIWRAANRTNPQ